MDEKKFLENFAKILGSSAQEELKKIEEKKLKEERLLKSFGAALSKSADYEIKIEEEIVQPPRQVKLADEFIKKAPQIIVETPIVHIETIAEPVVEEVIVAPPVLEVANLISQAVSATNVPADGKKTETDLINASLRKEIEVIKKSVSDFHKLVHDQSRKIALAGSSHGGGEVNLRYLDDIDRSSIRQGHFLTYDNSTKKFMFSQIAEGNVDLSHIDQQLTPGANGVYNLGSPTDYWANVYVKSLFLDGGGIEANGSFGTNNQVLASNGTVAYWANTNVVNSKTVTSSTYTILDSDYYVGINRNGAVTVTLPSSSTSGRNLIIKDESGNCVNNPITVSGNVDNDPSGFILKINNGGIHMLYNNESWRII
jgi:hypothetical protein